MYIQKGLVDIWKKNILENLKLGKLECKLVREFLAELKKKFGGSGNKLAKVIEFKQVE